MSKRMLLQGKGQSGHFWVYKRFAGEYSGR